MAATWRRRSVVSGHAVDIADPAIGKTNCAVTRIWTFVGGLILNARTDAQYVTNHRLYQPTHPPMPSRTIPL